MRYLIKLSGPSTDRNGVTENRTLQTAVTGGPGVINPGTTDILNALVTMLRGMGFSEDAVGQGLLGALRRTGFSTERIRFFGQGNPEGEAAVNPFRAPVQINTQWRLDETVRGIDVNPPRTATEAAELARHPEGGVRPWTADELREQVENAHTQFTARATGVYDQLRRATFLDEPIRNEEILQRPIEQAIEGADGPADMWAPPARAVNQTLAETPAQEPAF